MAYLLDTEEMNLLSFSDDAKSVLTPCESNRSGLARWTCESPVLRWSKMQPC